VDFNSRFCYDKLNKKTGDVMSNRGEFLDMKKITREDLIYLAGLIDGDGCFLISKRTKLTAAGAIQYMIKLQVQCIDEAFIDGLISIFGGVKIINRKKPPRNYLYGMEFTGNILTHICELLVPFLKLKKPNAENILEMRRTYNGRGGRIIVSDEDLAVRDKCFHISRSLNTHKLIKVLPPCLPSATQLGGPSQSE
jgi:hypothetical protein